MDFSKGTSKKNQIEISNFRHWLYEQSHFAHNSGIVLTDNKQCKENVRLNCLDCGVLLTSKLQAVEHFLGKKHQNILKSKANHNFSTKINIPAQFLTSRKNYLLKGRLQGSCNSRIQTFDNILETKNNTNIPPPAGRDNILETVVKSGRKNTSSSSDLSIYRTPSGKYYCQACNMTVNSQAQFVQHSESRKHKHKASKACKLK